MIADHLIPCFVQIACSLKERPIIGFLFDEVRLFFVLQCVLVMYRENLIVSTTIGSSNDLPVPLRLFF